MYLEAVCCKNSVAWTLRPSVTSFEGRASLAGFGLSGLGVGGFGLSGLGVGAFGASSGFGLAGLGDAGFGDAGFGEAGLSPVGTGVGAGVHLGEATFAGTLTAGCGV